MKLKDKVAVITGGSSGIGLAIAEEFIAEGANVVICGRNQAALDEASGGLGEKALAVRADVSVMTDLDRLFDETASRFGNIDVVVVNAGVAIATSLEETDEKIFDEQSDINFKGAYFTVQKASPHLNDGASIIFISSTANQMGLPNTSAYSATKAALRSLSRTLSTELLPRGIRVNTLSPGNIVTPILRKMGVEDIDAFLKERESQVPSGRFGTAKEVATAAVFLATSDSSYVVGSEVVADGGWSQL
ncbi:MAG: glucose 1-dehydrogenase [Chloroflexi bacterium]|nr:glucose 1-dehydrogenase [Chloroflexota bacterium]